MNFILFRKGFKTNTVHPKHIIHLQSFPFHVLQEANPCAEKNRSQTPTRGNKLVPNRSLWKSTILKEYFY